MKVLYIVPLILVSSVVCGQGSPSLQAVYAELSECRQRVLQAIRSNQLNDAADEALRGIARFSQNAGFRYLIGMIELKRGDETKALEWLEQVDGKYEDNVSKLVTSYLRARTGNLSGAIQIEPAEAIFFYHADPELRASYPQALNLRDAECQLALAIGMASYYSPDVFDNLCGIKEFTPRYWTEKAARINNNDYMVQYYLGKTLREDKFFERALVSLQKAEQLAPVSFRKLVQAEIESVKVEMRRLNP